MGIHCSKTICRSGIAGNKRQAFDCLAGAVSHDDFRVMIPFSEYERKYIGIE